MSYSHEPVLLEETLANLIRDKDGTYLDCTFGLGGHTKQILKNLSEKGSLFSIDKDLEVKYYADLISDKRFTFKTSAFSSISTLFPKKSMNGILFDLGVSSLQLDKPERGFSFMREGTLDMRFNNSSGVSAKDWINSASEKEIADVIYFLGEERRSRQFAKKIILARKTSKISTTKDKLNIFLFLSLLFSFVLVVYLLNDFQIKKTNAKIFKLNKLLNLEVDEKIELESRILAKKSLKKAFEVTSIELSMIRPEKVIYLEVVN